MKPTDALEIQHDYKWKCGDTQFRYILDKMILSASGMRHQTDETKVLSAQEVVNAYLESAVKVGITNSPC